jgi:uncharacterized protein (DUF1501 family)
MKRRDFLSNLGKIAAITPLMVSGIPMRAFGGTHHAKALNGVFDDRILILIQLHGGNDGINTLIPVDQYSTYQGIRANIAIPDTGARKYINLDSSLAANQQIGLHPDMSAFKSLYDGAKTSIVQGVGYEDTNFSHFRSRDVWFSGVDNDEYKNSGWMGRYLNHVFPNYPDAYPSVEMPDPLGLEIGSKVSLGYYRSQGIPTAIAAEDPENLNNLITNLGGPNPSTVPDNHYGSELQYIMDMFSNANDYAAQLEARYSAGSNNVQYPRDNFMQYSGTCPNNIRSNQLGPQLQTIARLIQGGSKTKIYLVRLDGFDTHDAQVAENSSTEGTHGALLFHLSNAVKAFFDDLAVSGMDEKVLAMTFTDFGRRPYSNGSKGTDHGTSSPTFIFGKGVEPGVIGSNPSLTNLDSTGNLLIQHDYRQVIVSVLCDWLGADMSAIQAAELDDFTDDKLSIIDPNGTSVRDSNGDLRAELNIYPNPVEDKLQIKISSNEALLAQLTVVDVSGKLTFSKQLQLMQGSNQMLIDAHDFAAGVYVLNIMSKQGKISRQFVKK